MSTKSIILIAIVLAAALVAYLVFFKKKLPAGTVSPVSSVSKQSAQQSLTGKVEDAALTVGVTAATDWLSGVNWGS